MKNNINEIPKHWKILSPIIALIVVGLIACSIWLIVDNIEVGEINPVKYETIVYTGLQVWQNGRHYIYTEKEIEALKPVLLDCDSIKIVHKLWITEK